MIVLGHRVLIKPDPQPERSGDLLLPEHRDWVSTSGTVVQVGPGGSRMRFEARQRAIQECIDAIQRSHGSTNDWFHAGIKIATERCLALLATTDPALDVQVGDRVAWDADHGHAITIGEEQFLILNMDDVIVIVQEAEEAA